MANENKITQIIINQEPYTIGEDSAGFATLTGSEMISTLKSGVYYIGADENLATVLFTIIPHRGNEYYVYAVTQNRIFIYDGVDTTLQTAFGKGYNILMSDTNMNTNVPIMRSDEYKLSEIGSNGFADIFGSSNGGFIIYDNVKFPEYQQLICLSAECKAFKFQGSEETVLNTAVQTAEPFMAEEDEDIVTKKYLDTALSGAGGIPTITSTTKLGTLNSGFYLVEIDGVSSPIMFLRVENTAMFFNNGVLGFMEDITDKTFEDTFDLYYGPASSSGDRVFTVSNKKIVEVNDPEDPKDAANKGYVDNLVQSSSSVPLVHTVEELLTSPSQTGEFEFTVPKDCMFWVYADVRCTSRPVLPGTGGSTTNTGKLYITISDNPKSYNYDYYYTGEFAGVQDFYLNYSQNTFGETEDVNMKIQVSPPDSVVVSMNFVRLSYIKFPTYTKDE